MKKLILHIGFEKTGTTFLQRFCKNNRKQLEKQNIIYPNVGFSTLAQFSLVAPFHPIDNEGKQLEFAPKKEYSIKNEWSGIKKIFDDRDNITVLISAELFSSRLKTKGIKALKETIDWLGNDIQTTIIAYLRRQDKYFESSYSTHIKAGGVLKFDEAFYMRLNNKWFYDYSYILDEWSKQFGADSIKIVPFESVQLKNGLLATFLDKTGIKLNESFDLSVDGENTVDGNNISWAPKMLELSRLINIKHKSSPIKDRYQYISKYEKYFITERRVSLLSPERAQLILDMYDDSNHDVAVNYLNRADGKLFLDPPPSNGFWEEPEHLTLEDLVDILLAEDLVRN